jgi:hypothetical protein
VVRENTSSFWEDEPVDVARSLFRSALVLTALFLLFRGAHGNDPAAPGDPASEVEPRLNFEELRQDVADWEARLRTIRRKACDPGAVLDAEGAFAVARARLAEAEGDVKRLAAELPQVIAHYERRLDVIERLLRVRAIDPREARLEQQEYRAELRRTRQRLESARKQLGKAGGGE